MLANRIYAVWLLVAWSGMIAVFSFNIPSIYRLNSHHGRTIAQVTGKDCGNHNSAFYSYTVRGTRYTGHETVPFSCDEMRNGKDFPILFDLNDPSVSTTGDPSEELVHAIIGLLWVGAIGIVLIFRMIPLWNRQTSVWKNFGATKN